MEIKIIPNAKTRFSGIIVSHNNEEIIFEGKGGLFCGDNEHDLFEPNNDYFTYFEDGEINDIFNLFKDAKWVLTPTYFADRPATDEFLRNNDDYRFLSKHLIPIIDKILDAIKPERFAYYVTQCHKYTAPPKDLEASANKSPYPDQININAEDYANLVQLSLLVRFVFPIISEFIDKLNNGISKEHKDAVSGALIENNRWIINNAGWEKLRVYIEYTYDTKGVNNKQLEIISEYKFVPYARIRTLFRNLCCCYIPSYDPEKNLPKLLYSGTKHYDAVPQHSFRSLKNEVDESGDKRSQFETRQLKEDVNSSKQVAEAEYVSFGLFDENDVERHTDMFKHQCKGLGINNHKLVQRCYELIPSGWDFYLTQHIIKLGQLIFIDDLSPNIVEALEYTQLKAYMALAQVMLHERGYPNLAILMTTCHNPNGESVFTDDIFDLTSEERDRLMALCDVTLGRGIVTTDNEAVACATEFLKELGNSSWLSTIEPGMLDSEKAIETARTGDLHVVDLNREIKTEFLRLAIEQNQ